MNHRSPRSTTTRQRLGLLATFCLAAALVAGDVLGGSLWSRGNSRTRSLVSDDVASEVGDILTIIIAEKSVISNKTSRSNENKTSRDIAVEGGTADLGDLTGGVGKHVFDFPQARFKSATAAKFDGKADYGTNRTMQDMMTVSVEDVLPNGNLVVIGSRIREVDGDKQTMQVSGIVRPSDIQFDNTVESDRVAEFHIVHKTKGQDSTYVQHGWLTRFVNIINPF